MPADSQGISTILQALGPSPSALLDVLRACVDDTMLAEIAAADWGHDVEQHFAPLKRARDTGEIPAPEWYPLEVLGLTKWSNPDNRRLTPVSKRERAHLIRAFACAILLRMSAEPTNFAALENQETAVVQLADSVLALGPATIEAAGRFLAWLISNRSERDWDRLPVEVALLILLADVPLLPKHGTQSSADQLMGLADWIISELPGLEREYRDCSAGLALLRDTFRDPLTRRTWQRLVRKRLLEPRSSCPEALQQKLAAVARLVVAPEAH